MHPGNIRHMTSSPDDETGSERNRHRSGEHRISRWRRRQDEEVVGELDPAEAALLTQRAAEADREPASAAREALQRADADDTAIRRVISDALEGGLADPVPADDRLTCCPAGAATANAPRRLRRRRARPSHVSPRTWRLGSSRPRSGPRSTPSRSAGSRPSLKRRSGAHARWRPRVPQARPRTPTGAGRSSQSARRRGTDPGAHRRRRGGREQRAGGAERGGAGGGPAVRGPNAPPRSQMPTRRWPRPTPGWPTSSASSTRRTCCRCSRRSSRSSSNLSSPRSRSTRSRRCSQRPSRRTGPSRTPC